MSGLGIRIAALLTIAIVVVIALVTLLAVQLLGPPGGPMGGGYRAFDRLALASALLFDASPGDADRLAAIHGLQIAAAPPDGRELRQESDAASALLARRGVETSVVILEAEDGPPLSAVRLRDGRWLTSAETLRGGPPRKDWIVFAFWLLLIATGTAGVVTFAVLRVTQPLRMLERAAAAVGPDGELAPLPERGPPEVRAAAQAINRLSSGLRNAMESRMRLVAAAGHDLRTPMTRMRLRAEFIPEGEDRDRWLADLAELDRIADSAIRLVREEVDPDARHPARIDAMMGDIIAELAEIGLDVRMTRASPAVSDVRPHAMKRALRNLVVNAATHGQAAAVAVTVTAQSVIVAIEDSGPGIPDALLERVFEPFFRVDPARKAPTPGAGLGMAIAREIIRRNSGELAVANRPAGGLVQVVTLPLWRASEEATA
ncbi:signal transduction histidine kinase [Methylopila capsulata]|uniref:histidine kinase n=1 Tax=Methylopila capsulata TaxID=61654 RepID=A0A9W6IUC2_9HYPH|nr:ATP-binding protein [Methylopila capsulata]MBM7852494.1 signal transduction histidine kinase [Methylopila capsulata]GLK56703.1 two-component sensor histidine kinase [Methylopila capsulata]